MEKNRLVTEIFFEKPNFEELSKISNSLKEAEIKSILLPPTDRGINTHLVVEHGDLENARTKLNEMGLKYREKEVLLIYLENKPGTMADAAVKISKAGINVTYAFSITMDDVYSLVVMRSSDNKGALKSLEE